MNTKTLFFICSVFFAMIALNIWALKIDIKRLEQHHIDEVKYSYAYDCIREAELQYWDYKYQLTSEIQNYINTIAPSSNLRAYALIDECEKYNIDIKFVLAQAEIESHFGTKGIGGKLNNVFNIGVFDGYSPEKVAKNFKYDYPNESIEPYLKLLTERYLIDKLEEDLMINYVDINGRRYASDEHYEEKLRNKYNIISTSTKIDEYQALMKSDAIKCNRYTNLITINN